MGSIAAGQSLDELLAGVVERRGAEAGLACAARAVGELARAAAQLSEIIARPAADADLGASVGAANADGDAQKRLDVIADQICTDALRRAGVGAFLSEETPGATMLNADGEIAVAIDPLDGSSNIEVNGVIGTIFSILPSLPGAEDPARAFFVAGRQQIAAGFFSYGPQTTLTVSFGEGVHIFALDRDAGRFVLTHASVRIPQGLGEYAINASNHHHWREPVRRFIEHCLAGLTGPHARSFNMRWAGALAFDAYRVFIRGGLFLYPADARAGYEQGRLRLLYEVAPMAFLAEQAGGAATDGERDVLDRVPARLHERCPLVLGPRDGVDLVRRYHLEPELIAQGSAGIVVGA
ncbi:MAG TPA: class 1 fructose-bisphosphatase [Caulobacteraceae bacterium]|nr:class 1 fructose-bisphosphatase [Caulobacteraceae bacterium]